MPHTLEDFAARCRAILMADNTSAGREKVCAVVREYLTYPDFIAAHLKDDGPERKVLYEDPDLRFCILGHVYHGAKNSSPHDHGPTWAIYGQATGTTIMTDWEAVTPATDATPGTAKPVRDYELTPGMAYYYEPGVLHSPRREASTKLIRMEGFDLTGYKRHAYKPVSA